MITNFFLNTIYNLFIAPIIDTAPAYFPAEFHTYASILGSYTGGWSDLLPFSTLAICIGLIISVQLLVFAFHFLKWIIKLVRG